ncbi:winged helix-turn-helix domain-containing protein [Aliivibrio sifiae]|uniref:winged helix-turn-helix domain-containing protein n=1 Tax=Aliivibrio sifiae TaxID=566293 RepID=UPI003D0E6450
MLITIDKRADNVEVYSFNNSILNIKEKVNLNHSEILILEELLINRGTELLRDDLISIGWPSRIVGNNSLNVSIMNLRKKISFCSKSFNIKTVPSIGYKLVLDDSVEFIFYEDLIERLNDDNLQLNESRDSIYVSFNKYSSYVFSLLIILYGLVLFNALYIRYI